MDKLFQWLSENGTVLVGACFAFMISLLTSKRVKLMDKLANSLLCSLFSTGLYYAILSFFPQCSQYLAVAVGTFVGTFGVDETKKVLKQKIMQFLNISEENPENGKKQ